MLSFLSPSWRQLIAHEHKQYCWTVAPQAAANSAGQYSEALQTVLQGWSPTHEGSMLLQYIDNLMLCGSSEQACSDDSVSFMTLLADNGCKAAQPKLQFCQETIVFLGHWISQGIKCLAPERIKAIQQISIPRSTEQQFCTWWSTVLQRLDFRCSHTYASTIWYCINRSFLTKTGSRGKFCGP